MYVITNLNCIHKNSIPCTLYNDFMKYQSPRAGAYFVVISLHKYKRALICYLQTNKLYQMCHSKWASLYKIKHKRGIKCLSRDRTFYYLKLFFMFIILSWKLNEMQQETQFNNKAYLLAWCSTKNNWSEGWLRYVGISFYTLK